MNKDELEHRIKTHENAIQASESVIALLRTQLAEAEKPKLRHGDFGITNSPYVVVSQPNCIMGSPKAIYADGGGQANADKVISSDTRLGNVFDLMKGWSEPFENCGIINSEKGEFYFQLEAVNRKQISFKLNNTGNWFHASIPEAEEIHNALGHAIAELKRKENKN